MDQREALGIPQESDLAIELMFAQHYHRDLIKPQIRIGVVQNASSVFSFGLSRALESRMRKLIEDWPWNMHKKHYSVGKVKNLMELAEADFITCRAVLNHFSNNENQSALFLIDGNPSEIERIVQEFLLGDDDVSCGAKRRRTPRFSAKLESFSCHANLEAKLLSQNVLLKFLHELVVQVQSLDSHCFICGDELPYSSIKPSICDKELCSFQHEEIGVGFDLETEIKVRPEVTDLLISLCLTAAQSGRLHICFPKNIYKKNKKTPAFSHDRAYEEVIQVLSRCPSISEMREMSEKGVLFETLNRLDPLLKPLLKWIITSNRCHLRLLSPEQHIPTIPSRYQFVLLSSSPAKETKFQRRKQSIARRGYWNPSVFAFHGSPLGNWHSILRLGLKNMSNTEDMLHGASYGEGVYFSLEASTSITYSCRYDEPIRSWKKSMLGEDWSCFAVCELLNNKLPSPKPFYVIADEEIIATRFFCILDSRQMSKPQAHSSNLKLPDILTNKELQLRPREA
jgi:hypothetical protein